MRLDDETLAVLVAAAASRSGYAPSAVFPEAVRRQVAARLPGESSAALRQRLEADDARLDEALRAAVAIGETYFFRHPEHFALVSERVLPRLGRPVRALSAGCASGEEAWSLAACVSAQAGAATEVVGLDVSEAALEIARRGEYSRWSVRSDAASTWSALHPTPDGYVVEPTLRPRVRFQQHDLREPIAPVFGLFQVIFCRNVLVYLDAKAATRVVASLEGALAPDGVLVLGAMDAERSPRGLRPLGPPGVLVLERAPAAGSRAAHRRTRQIAPPRARTTAGRRALPPPLARPEATPPRCPAEAVARHVEALGLVERGDRARARAVLEELAKKAPDYVPGLFERALLLHRLGERKEATGLARRVLEGLAHRADDEVVAAPEPLPVAYYRQAARALLGELDRGRGA